MARNGKKAGHEGRVGAFVGDRVVVTFEDGEIIAYDERDVDAAPCPAGDLRSVRLTPCAFAKHHTGSHSFEVQQAVQAGAGRGSR